MKYFDIHVNKPTHDLYVLMRACPDVMVMPKTSSTTDVRVVPTKPILTYDDQLVFEHAVFKYVYESTGDGCMIHETNATEASHDAKSSEPDAGSVWSCVLFLTILMFYITGA